MTRAAVNRGAAPRRFPAILLVGLPLVVGAVWLAPAAQRWIDGGEAGAVRPSSMAAAHDASAAPAGAEPSPVAGTTPPAAPLPPDAVFRQAVADVRSREPATRADALARLANAPREQALPILQDLLKDGAYPDRQMVIESLAILARLQGDADERIRTAFRVELYDGSDEATTRAAQQALDDLEADLR